MRPQPILSRLTVLIVDDNQHMRAILVSLLRAVGLGAIVEATDGADALLQLQMRNIDIVLCDISMHPLDGIEFARMVRTSPDSRSPTVPIIMVTGHTERARVEEARDAGINEFIAKPLSTAILVQRLSAVIERPRDFVSGGRYAGPDRRRHTATDHSGPFRRSADR